jgi:hypothetical protein
MGVLMISCPSTGRDVSTGIETERVDHLPTVIANTTCSACGGVHPWTKDDARLVPGGDLYRQAARARRNATRAGRPTVVWREPLAPSPSFTNP